MCQHSRPLKVKNIPDARQDVPPPIKYAAPVWREWAKVLPVAEGGFTESWQTEFALAKLEKKKQRKLEEGIRRREQRTCDFRKLTAARRQVVTEKIAMKWTNDPSPVTARWTSNPRFIINGRHVARTHAEVRKYKQEAAWPIAIVKRVPKHLSSDLLKLSEFVYLPLFPPTKQTGVMPHVWTNMPQLRDYDKNLREQLLQKEVSKEQQRIITYMNDKKFSHADIVRALDKYSTGKDLNVEGLKVHFKEQLKQNLPKPVLSDFSNIMLEHSTKFLFQGKAYSFEDMKVVLANKLAVATESYRRRCNLKVFRRSMDSASRAFEQAARVKSSSVEIVAKWNVLAPLPRTQKCLPRPSLINNQTIWTPLEDLHARAIAQADVRVRRQSIKQPEDTSMEIDAQNGHPIVNGVPTSPQWVTINGTTVDMSQLTVASFNDETNHTLKQFFSAMSFANFRYLKTRLQQLQNDDQSGGRVSKDRWEWLNKEMTAKQKAEQGQGKGKGKDGPKHNGKHAPGSGWNKNGGLNGNDLHIKGKNLKGIIKNWNNIVNNNGNKPNNKNGPGPGNQRNNQNGQNHGNNQRNQNANNNAHTRPHQKHTRNNIGRRGGRRPLLNPGHRGNQ